MVDQTGPWYSEGTTPVKEVFIFTSIHFLATEGRLIARLLRLRYEHTGSTVDHDLALRQTNYTGTYRDQMINHSAQLCQRIAMMLKC